MKLSNILILLLLLLLPRDPSPTSFPLIDAIFSELQQQRLVGLQQQQQQLENSPGYLRDK